MTPDKPQEDPLQQSPFNLTEYCRGKIQELLASNQERNPSSNWLSSLYFELEQESRVLCIYFPHLFLAEWFEQKLKKGLRSTIAQDLLYVQEIRCRTFASKARRNIFSSYVPDTNYSFTNFLYNSQNYLAVTSAYELAHNSSIKSNPFLLLGRKGSGKTHLLKAIANTVATKKPESKILFTDVQELDHRIKKNFQSRKYLPQYVSEFDLLIIDSIDDLDFYTYLQPELTSIFDNFQEQEKQMIFACRGKIRALEFMQSKLKSRLEAGLLIPVHAPDLEIRTQYLQNQTQARKLNLSQEQILYLALHYPDFKSLYRTVLHLLSQSSLHSLNLGSLDMESFQEKLPRDIQSAPAQLSNQKIISLVAEHFSLSQEQLSSGYQDRKTVLARQTAMYLCRRLLGQTYAQIGKTLGDKDHSTVLYSCQKIQKLRKDSKEMKSVLKTLEQKCR
ncbi:MAG: DnaA ATPase domain-containing protein [Desulfohalobiaceae bacterium]